MTFAILGVSVSWLYKWLHREPPSASAAAALDKRVRELFERSKGTYGSPPRVHADLIDESWLCDSHATDGSLHARIAAIATSLRTLGRLCRNKIGMTLPQ